MRQKPMLGCLPDLTRFPWPAALWPCIKAGNLIDLSGNKNVGTIVGTGLWKPEGLNFDGSGDYVTFGLIDAITDDVDYTLVWRMMLNATPGTDDFIFSQYRNSNDRFGITMQGTTLDFGHYNGASYNAVGTNNALAANIWYVCAAVNYADTTKKLYVNGVEDTGAGSGENPAGTGFIIGNRSTDSPSKYFDGVMSYVVIFLRALTAQQITQLYREPFPWFVEDDISGLYVPGAPPAVVVSPYYYQHLMQGAAA